MSPLKIGEIAADTRRQGRARSFTVAASFQNRSNHRRCANRLAVAIA
jgi:hypothetical protein